MNFASGILFDMKRGVLEPAAVDELTAEQGNGPDDD
jgi:hypothetical protein